MRQGAVVAQRPPVAHPQRLLDQHQHREPQQHRHHRQVPDHPPPGRSGRRTMSPRGRIKLMREVQDNDAPVSSEVIDAFSTCVQCRGCEPACPSGVPYGHMMESARETLADAMC